MKSIKETVIALGGDIEAKIVGLWKVKLAICSKEDAEEFGYIEGEQYAVWVASKDGKSQAGNPVKAKTWFAAEPS